MSHIEIDQNLLLRSKNWQSLCGSLFDFVCELYAIDDFRIDEINRHIAKALQASGLGDSSGHVNSCEENQYSTAKSTVVYPHRFIEQDDWIEAIYFCNNCNTYWSVHWPVGELGPK